MKQETRSTLELVYLANQLSHAPDESPERTTAKILNLQLQETKAPH